MTNWSSRPLWRRRAFRLWLWWLLVAALVVIGAIDDDDDERPEPVTVALTPSTMDDGSLAISSVKPAEVYAGSAVIARVHGVRSGQAPLVHARIGGQPTTILHASEDQLVIEIPSELAPGSTTLEVLQGKRRSNSLTVRIKRLRARKVLRTLVGGLALFVFGLRMLARGFRGYAGNTMRTALTRWTQGRVRGLAFGVGVGGVGQSVLSATAFVLGLLESRLITFGAALIVLLGAHLGAGLAILVLPAGLSRQALWVVAIGVAWITLARNRRSEAAGKLVLGIGLLFYGMTVLRTGFQPIMGDPDMLPYLQALRSDGMVGLSSRLGAGMVMGALLQGPGAVFGLVLSISESTGLIELHQCLEILAATNFGASLGTLVLTLPFGRTARRLALGHLCIGALTTLLFFALLLPSAATIGTALGTDPAALDYGKKILLPNFAPHLALSYGVAQVLSVGLVTVFAPAIGAALLRLMPRGQTSPDPSPTPSSLGAEPLEEVSEPLARSLESNREAMDITLALLRAGAREEAATADEGISRVRSELKQTIGRLVHHGDEATTALGTCVAVLNLQRSLEQLQRLGERGIEKNYTVDTDTAEDFRSLYQQICEGLEEVIEHLRDQRPLDIDTARAREITVNATEAELRQRQLRIMLEHPEREHELLWRIEVFGTYEHVGNHVYRIAEVLTEGLDDDF